MTRLQTGWLVNWHPVTGRVDT